MEPDRSPEVEVARGRRATQIMNDPLMVESCAIIRAGLREKFFETAKKDTELREVIWQMSHFFEEFMRFFAATIESGKMAEFEIEARRKRAKSSMMER